MTYGLTEDTLQKMADVFARMPKLEEVILYGSRARGNYRAGSDIDLALKGIKLDINDLLKIAADLDELDLAYHFDLLLFDNVKSPDLLEHIRTEGKIIWINRDLPKPLKE